MDTKEEEQTKADSQPSKNLTLADKGLKTLNEKFIQENTEKIKKEQESGEKKEK